MRDSGQDGRGRRAKAYGWAWLGGSVSGAAIAFAFPPLGLWPMAFVALAPLLLAIRGRAWGPRVVAGVACGATANLILFSWIYEGTHHFLYFPPAAAAMGTAVLALTQAGPMAAYTLLAEPARRLGAALWPLLSVSLYLAAEWTLPRIAPWPLGIQLLQWPPLGQICDLTGPAGPAALVVLTSTVCSVAIAERRVPRSAAVALLAVGLTLGYGWHRIDVLDRAPVERALKVALVHTHFGAYDRGARAVDWHQSALQDLARATRDVHHDADLVVWPEGALTFPLHVQEGDRDATDAVARQLSRYVWAYAGAIPGHLLAGAARAPVAGAPMRNSVIHYRRDGSVGGIYDKRRLVPFAESRPDAGVQLREEAPVAEPIGYSPGEAAAMFDVDGVLVSPSICYEGLFWNQIREAANTGGHAQVLVNVTSDFHLATRGQPDVHLLGQHGRAIENRLPLLRATNGGITAYIDEAGRVVESFRGAEPSVVFVEVPIRDIGSPYRVAGDVFPWGLIATGAVGWGGALAARRAGERRAQARRGGERPAPVS